MFNISIRQLRAEQVAVFTGRVQLSVCCVTTSTALTAGLVTVSTAHMNQTSHSWWGETLKVSFDFFLFTSFIIWLQYPLQPVGGTNRTWWCHIWLYIFRTISELILITSYMGRPWRRSPRMQTWLWGCWPPGGSSGRRWWVEDTRLYRFHHRWTACRPGEEADRKRQSVFIYTK